MTAQTQSAVFDGGFENPPVNSAEAFRAAMNAMARPGTSHEINGAVAPEGISVAAASLLLTLCDPEIGLYLAPSVDSKSLREWLAFHTGARIVDAEDADFAIGNWSELCPLDRFAIGTSEYPDRSATLIVEMGAEDGVAAALRGPGIKDSATMELPDIASFQNNALLYPLGLDFFFTSGTQVLRCHGPLKSARKDKPCMLL